MTEDMPYLRQGVERAPRVVRARDPEDDRYAVAVRLMGPAAAVDRLASVTLPGLREVVRKPLDGTDVPSGHVVAYGYVLAGPHVHDYVSTYCQHEADNADDAVAAHLHALCAATVGLCGEKIPGVCKVCRAKCQCPEHASDHKDPVTTDG